jgi:hypothetical protein
LVEWFGFEHNMHDAEVQSVHLQRHPEVSVIRMRAFRMTPEVDDRGYYISDRHAIVSFQLEGVKAIQVENWEFCSILMNVEWELSGGLHRLTLVSVVDGSETVLSAERITVAVEPIEG